MNKFEIRKKFQELIGEELYLKFLWDLHTLSPSKDRLYFWQQDLWDQFEKEYDLPSTELSTIKSYFQYCPLHNIEFKRDVVPVVDGETLSNKEIKLLESRSLFPYAHDVLYRRVGIDTPDKKETHINAEAWQT